MADYYRIELTGGVPDDNDGGMWDTGTDYASSFVPDERFLPATVVAAQGWNVPQYGGATATEIAAILKKTLSEIKVYVLESEITEAQRAVKSVVEQAMF